ncbi:MAG: hypothetical protein PHP00_07205 [Thiotrichaceae bacterium]|nr:hypothetical protein [Thiotrichaceae bacterium]
MPFPVHRDYVDSVTHLDKFICDPKFKGGRARSCPKSHRLILYSGGFSVVFPIDVGKETLALRCWTAGLSNADKRYIEITKYLQNVKLPYFVDFAYVQEGILVKGLKYPIIRMDWATGDRLKDFIAKYINDPTVLLATAHAFSSMVKALHVARISHGDLQHDNILVSYDKNTVSLKLIDYDSLYVPNLKGQEEIRGLPAYQHPTRINPRSTREVSEKVDYFSELVIYLSLCSLAEKPKLWTSYDIEDSEGLLFSASDFENPALSKIIRELGTLSPKIQNMTTQLVDFCAKSSTDDLVPLDDIIQSPHYPINQSVDNIRDILRGAIHSQKVYPTTKPNNHLQKQTDSIKDTLKSAMPKKNTLKVSFFQKMLHRLFPKYFQKKSLGKTILLSSLIPGLGHLYNGQILSGITMFIVTVSAYLLLVFVGILVHLWVIIESACHAHKSICPVGQLVSKRLFIFSMCVFSFYIVPQALFCYEKGVSKQNECTALIKSMPPILHTHQGDEDELCASCLLTTWNFGTQLLDPTTSKDRLDELQKISKLPKISQTISNINKYIDELKRSYVTH